MDPWATWDQRVKQTGDPGRVAQDLTNAELVMLLAIDGGRQREQEKRILREVAFDRMRIAASQPRPPEDADIA